MNDFSRCGHAVRIWHNTNLLRYIAHFVHHQQEVRGEMSVTVEKVKTLRAVDSHTTERARILLAMAKSKKRSKSSAKAPKSRAGKAKGKPAKKTLTANPKASTLAGRLRAVAGPMTFREVGLKTGTHPENARRYLQGGSVGLRFFKNFCKAFDVSADWLLEGTGQQARRR